MRRSRLLPLVICMVSALLIAGCYQPGGPIPENPNPAAPRAWTTAEVNAAVEMTQETIYAPMSRTSGTPPAECDNLRYLRFKLRSGGKPDAILVLTPGVMCGADVFNYLGREMVYMAQREGHGNLEVWALEWRSNRAEDLTGLNAAEAAHDTNVAIDYYYNGAEIDGHTFQGFAQSDQLPWLSEIGLGQAMQDIYTVITTNVPDPVERRSKVFVGGHSLGGFFTAAFAGWDFDGDPNTLDDAGYRNCAGLVGLDTLVKSTKEMVDPILDLLPQDLHDGLNNVAENTFGGLVDGLRQNALPRFLPLPAITPEGFMLLELMAMEADWAPDQESSLMQRTPYSSDVDYLIKLLQSKDIFHYLIHIPGIRDYRFTNTALLGGIIDDNFMPVSIMQMSLGFMNGGSMQRKDFPLPSDLANIPGLTETLGVLLSLKNMYIPWDAGTITDGLGKGPLYGWTNFDQISAGTDTAYTDTTGQVTYTNQVEEVTDFPDFARTFYQGPTNFFDWYYPTRLVMDLVGMSFPWGPEFGLNYLHGDHVSDLPKVEFLAEHGPFTTMSGLYPGNYVMCQGYNHVDVLTAAADRPALRPNEVFDPLLNFVFTNLGN